MLKNKIVIATFYLSLHFAILFFVSTTDKNINFNCNKNFISLFLIFLSKKIISHNSDFVS